MFPFMTCILYLSCPPLSYYNREKICFRLVKRNESHKTGLIFVSLRHRNFRGPRILFPLLNLRKNV